MLASFDIQTRDNIRRYQCDNPIIYAIHARQVNISFVIHRHVDNVVLWYSPFCHFALLLLSSFSHYLNTHDAIYYDFISVKLIIFSDENELFFLYFVLNID